METGDSHTSGKSRWYNISLHYALLFSFSLFVTLSVQRVLMHTRVAYAYFRGMHALLLQLRIRALCSSAGKTSERRQWSRLRNDRYSLEYSTSWIFHSSFRPRFFFPLTPALNRLLDSKSGFLTVNPKPLDSVVITSSWQTKRVLSIWAKTGKISQSSNNFHLNLITRKRAGWWIIVNGTKKR